MKIIDKNGRLFGKISIIDLLVILVVAVLALALHTKNNEQEITSGSTPDAVITYQVKAEAIPDSVASSIRVGDRMYETDRSTGGSIGEIVAIEDLGEGTRWAALQDGTVILAPVEGTRDLLLTIEGRGIESNGHFLINRIYELGYNAARNFSNQYAQFVGSVVAIGD